MAKTIIIAEAGVNHNGSIALAKKLIDVASDAKVDYVKFQTYRTENIVTRDACKADYQVNNVHDNDMSQFKMLKRLELSKQDHFELITYCKQKGVKFFSTAFDLDSVNFLDSLDMSLWKIPSGELTNYPYLRAIGRTNKPVILSTGMATMKEVQEAISVLEKFGTPKNGITLLHCTTEYPAPKDQINLRAMNTMREYLGVPVGYSDHTEGIEIPIAAVAMGAVVIEKHFTLDRNMEGPDHKASIEPAELRQMVKYIRNIESAMGNTEKKPTPVEQKNISIVRKSIVAARPIHKGEVFNEENLTTKRPATGISPMKWHEVLGLIASQDFEKDEVIKL
ncbi:MAG: N,N'-diacetyllegionaminic acid synthase [Parabacteroides sp.]